MERAFQKKKGSFCGALREAEKMPRPSCSGSCSDSSGGQPGSACRTESPQGTNLIFNAENIELLNSEIFRALLEKENRLFELYRNSF